MRAGRFKKPIVLPDGPLKSAHEGYTRYYFTTLSEAGELGLDAVANPVRVPPLDGAYRDAVQQHHEVQVVTARQTTSSAISAVRSSGSSRL